MSYGPLSWQVTRILNDIHNLSLSIGERQELIRLTLKIHSLITVEENNNVIKLKRRVA